MKKAAVILSGCGVFDGSEIHESAITLLALVRGGSEYECFAPDGPMEEVINHSTQAPVGENRNVLVESARIARGKVRQMSDYNPADFDVLVIPGGAGAVKNLSTFAKDGPGCTIDHNVQNAILETHKAGKPIGAICISPALVARAFKDTDVQVTVTIGKDNGPAGGIREMGAKHVTCGYDEIYVDEANRIVTTPAYMEAGNIAEAAVGIEKLVEKLLAL